MMKIDVVKPIPLEKIEAEIDASVERIRFYHFSTNELNLRSTAEALREGGELVYLKEFYKHNRKEIGIKPWSSFIAKRAPFLEERTRQRYMQAARHVNPENDPVLVALGITRILRIIRMLPNGSTLLEFLVNEGYNPNDFESTDKDSLNRYCYLIDRMIKRSSPICNKPSANRKPAIIGRPTNGNTSRLSSIRRTIGGLLVQSYFVSERENDQTEVSEDEIRKLVLQLKQVARNLKDWIAAVEG